MKIFEKGGLAGLTFSAVGPPEGPRRRRRELEKVSEGVLGALQGAAQFFWGAPRPPKERFVGPRGLPRRVRSVFENVKKQLFFMLFGPWGEPEAAWGGLGASFWPSGWQKRKT